jgi:hypothetical protein
VDSKFQEFFSDPVRIEQVKSYGIGGGGIITGSASKSVPYFSYPNFIEMLQDGTIILGFLLVLVRLLIDMRRFYRDQKERSRDGD